MRNGALGERLRPRVTVKDAANTRGARLVDHRAGVVLGIASMDDERAAKFFRERNLSRKCCALFLSRRIVVVIVEPALADGDGSGVNTLLDERQVTRRVKLRRVVGVHAGGKENESRLRLSDSLGSGGRGERLADADDRFRARVAGASDYRVAVAVEGRVREVGVAVDEDDLPSVRRGHFRSIHSRMGAAT